MNDTIPILLDTDPGSDIDDAVCIAYLLKQRRCELVGITTVSGDVTKRAALAQMICDAAGRKDIPIHAGLPGPLLHGPGQPSVPQYDVVKSRPHRNDFAPGSAIEFMRETIRKRPGEITLLAIGPMTNIAVLFATDPEIPSLLKGMVSMAGVFTPGHSWGEAEWNCWTDSIATAMVYPRVPRGHLSVGLDVTTQCQMHRDEVKQRFAVPVLDVVYDMATAWFTDRKLEITFHDPLAATLLFRPELCEYAMGTVDVVVNAEHKVGGRTLFTPAADGPHRIATKVDRNAFFNEYFSVFG